jgi:hypothetical protein
MSDIIIICIIILPVIKECLKHSCPAWWLTLYNSAWALVDKKDQARTLLNPCLLGCFFSGDKINLDSVLFNLSLSPIK